MIYVPHLRGLIADTLQDIGLYSRAAEELLLGTCAQESKMGTYLRQLGGGPALGIFQMEPATHNDIWKTHLLNKDMGSTILYTCEMRSTPYNIPNPDTLTYNIRYAICMARMHYRRIPTPLPDASDIPALAAYWKRYYNTELGAGTEAEYINNYTMYV